MHWDKIPLTPTQPDPCRLLDSTTPLPVGPRTTMIHEFPGIAISGSGPSHPSRSDCVDLLGQSRLPAFPYYRDWNFGLGSDLKPKICITTSTSANLEQILPWIFYHKVIGVSNFFLFVEGKAASANVTKVLESIPGVKVIYRTRELGEQQAKRRYAWKDSFTQGWNFQVFIYKYFLNWVDVFPPPEASNSFIHGTPTF